MKSASTIASTILGSLFQNPRSSELAMILTPGGYSLNLNERKKDSTAKTKRRQLCDFTNGKCFNLVRRTCCPLILSWQAQPDLGAGLGRP